MPDLHHFGRSPEFGAQCGQTHGMDANGTWHEFHHSMDALESISRLGLPVCSTCLAATRESRAVLQDTDVADSIADFRDRRPQIEYALKDELASLLAAGHTEHRRQQEKRVALTHECSFFESKGGWRWRCSCGAKGYGRPTRASCMSAHDRHKRDELSRILEQESALSDVQIREPDHGTSTET